VIYAITTDGKLLGYRHKDPCSTSDIGGPTATLGSGNWQTYKSVFAGDCGVIYAITT